MRTLRLTWRDAVATLLVGAAGLLYVVWLTVTGDPGASGTRLVGALVLGLGLAASFVSVVFGIGAGLFRASKAYLAIASLIGLGALVAGVMTLVNGDAAMLATLVATTLVLWLISTARHMITGERPSAEQTIGGAIGSAASG